MHLPPFVGWLLAATCALVTVVCVCRAVASSGLSTAERRASAPMAVMGVGMAAMALPGHPVPGWMLLATFALAALWSARLAWAGVPHQFHHLAEAGAMIYMTLAMAPPGTGTGGHAGHGAGGHGAATVPGGWPLLTGALALYFTLYALRAATLLAPPLAVPGAVGAAPATASTAPSAPQAERLVDQAETGVACRLTFAVAMAAMLVTL